MAKYIVKGKTPLGLGIKLPKLEPGETFDGSECPKKALALLEGKGRIEKVVAAKKVAKKKAPESPPPSQEPEPQEPAKE